MAASAMVDARYPHSNQARRIRRELNDRCADVYPIRLWCWGILQGVESGRFEATPEQLAEIVLFFGKPEDLLRAFLDCEVIEKTDNPDEFRINGWKMYGRFFKERDRLRDKYKKKTPRKIPAKSPENSRGNPVFLPRDSRVVPVPVPVSPVLRNTGEENALAGVLEKASDEYDSRAEIQPPKPRTTRGFPEAAFESEFAELATVKVAKFNQLESSIGGQLVLRCGTDGITQGQLLAEWWRPEWRTFHGNTVKQLERHYPAVLAAIHDPTQRPKQKRDPVNDPPPGYRPIPSVEETAERHRKDREEAERIANDPGQQARISEIKARIMEQHR